MDAEHDIVLAALRTFPLFDFDRSRIETRAFFLSESRPDHLKNWLEAERTETIKQAEDALVFCPTAREFLLRYELVDRVRFVTNEPRRKVYRGDRRNKRCTVCGASSPAVRFSTEPHLLPACTGNRFLYTAEECDACNLGAGQDAENELGKMLAPHRAMSRVQTRSKPSTTLRLGEKTSAIGGQERDAPLNLSLVEGSTTVQVRDVDDETIEVHGSGAPYRPIAALRSLGRSAWHLLSDEQKSQNQAFLQWVRTSPSQAPARYIEAFIPGPGLRHTTFAVWRRRASTGPELVYLLALGGLILIVPSPDDYSTELPIPPLPYSPYGQPKLRRVTLLKDDPVSPTFSYEVRFLSRSLRSAPPSQSVRAVATRNGTAVELRCDLDIVSATAALTGPVAYSLRGGQLRGDITITGHPLRLAEDGTVYGGNFSVMYGAPDDATTATGDVDATYEFVAAIASGAELTILLDSGRPVANKIVLLPVANFDSSVLAEALGRRAT